MKQTINLMRLSLIFIAVSSLSLMSVTIADFNGSGFQRFSAYLTGVVFWALLIAGYILLLSVSKRRKADKNVAVSDKRPGIICFFTGKKAMIADIAMFAVILLFLLFLFIPVGTSVRIIMISLLVLTVQMHCILNGVNYRYIRLLTKEK